ncbi:uncharacterized protein LOC112056397 isoform X2 [Bicyclus anynana]|uniref:Uncharacterized protein LOC112056397 isoform X2 n=1 Tax=Bicyclus anynana TaxID=110368 RepID=A0A6J1NYB3_BICAN|nr:uncharacterized protein LOC112056397 isoform X2 [Bicyclus anynana]
MSKNLKIRLTYEEDNPVPISFLTPALSTIPLFKNTVIPGVQPKEETVIIVPNTGVNSYPYNKYYPGNPASRYGANTGTTVIVSNPDSNYDSVHGGKYLPNNYANKYG